MFNYFVWLKNRLVDAYYNWKYGEIVFTKEEVEDMCAMFFYAFPEEESVVEDEKDQFCFGFYFVFCFVGLFRCYSCIKKSVNKC